MIKQKWYNVIIDNEIVGKVEPSGNLVYTEDGNTTIGQLVGQFEDVKFATNGMKHERNDLDGKEVIVDTRP